MRRTFAQKALSMFLAVVMSIQMLPLAYADSGDISGAENIVAQKLETTTQSKGQNSISEGEAELIATEDVFVDIETTKSKDTDSVPEGESLTTGENLAPIEEKAEEEFKLLGGYLEFDSLEAFVGNEATLRLVLNRDDVKVSYQWQTKDAAQLSENVLVGAEVEVETEYSYPEDAITSYYWLYEDISEDEWLKDYPHATWPGMEMWRAVNEAAKEVGYEENISFKYQTVNYTLVGFEPLVAYENGNLDVKFVKGDVAVQMYFEDGLLTSDEGDGITEFEWVNIDGATDATYTRTIAKEDENKTFRCLVTVEDAEYIEAAKEYLTALGNEVTDAEVTQLGMGETSFEVYDMDPAEIIDAPYEDIPAQLSFWQKIIQWFKGIWNWFVGLFAKPAEAAELQPELVGETDANGNIVIPKYIKNLDYGWEYITEDFYNLLKHEKGYGYLEKTDDGSEVIKVASAQFAGWTNLAGGTKLNTEFTRDALGNLDYAKHVILGGVIPVKSDWYGKTIYFRKVGAYGENNWVEIKIPEITTGVHHYKTHVSILNIYSAEDFKAVEGKTNQAVPSTYVEAALASITNNGLFRSEYSKDELFVSLGRIAIEKFNSLPSKFLYDAEGTAIYDAVVFNGNHYAEPDLSGAAYWALKDYVSQGYGLIIGHDTFYAYAGAYKDIYGIDYDEEMISPTDTTTRYDEYHVTQGRSGHYNMNQLVGWNNGYYLDIVNPDGSATVADKTEALRLSPSGIISSGGEFRKGGALANIIQKTKYDVDDDKEKDYAELITAQDTYSGAEAAANVLKRNPVNYPYYTVHDRNDNVVDITSKGVQFYGKDTHSNGQVAFGDVWIKFDRNGRKEVPGVYTDNFYLAGSENFLMNQVGHTNAHRKILLSEIRILINSVFHVSQRKQCEICQANQNDSSQMHYVHRINEHNADKIFSAWQEGGNYWYSLDDCYMLMADVELPSNWAPLNNFTGHFNANGHKITLPNDNSTFFNVSGGTFGDMSKTDGKLEVFSTHSHTDDCYDYIQTLVCGRAILHTHSESCYETTGDTSTPLICRYVEHKAHSSSCWEVSENKELLCGKIEGNQYPQTSVARGVGYIESLSPEFFNPVYTEEILDAKTNEMVKVLKTDINFSTMRIKVYGSDGNEYIVGVNGEGKYVISNLPCTGRMKAELYSIKENGDKEIVIPKSVLRITIPGEGEHYQLQNVVSEAGKHYQNLATAANGFWANPETTELWTVGVNPRPIENVVTMEEANAVFKSDVEFTELVDNVQWKAMKYGTNIWTNIEDIAELSGKITVSAPKVTETVDEDIVLTSSTLTLKDCGYTLDQWRFTTVWTEGTTSVESPYGALTIEEWPMRMVQAPNVEVWESENISLTIASTYFRDINSGLKLEWQYHNNNGYSTTGWYPVTEAPFYRANSTNSITTNSSESTSTAYTAIALQHGINTEGAYLIDSTLSLKNCTSDLDGKYFRIKYTYTAPDKTTHVFYSNVANGYSYAWNKPAFSDHYGAQDLNRHAWVKIKPAQIAVVLQPADNEFKDTFTPDRFGQALKLEEDTAPDTAVYRALVYSKPASDKLPKNIEWKYSLYSDLKNEQVWNDDSAKALFPDSDIEVKVDNKVLGIVDSSSPYYSEKYPGFEVTESTMTITNAPSSMYDPINELKYFFSCHASGTISGSSKFINGRTTNKGGLVLEHDVSLEHMGVHKYGGTNIIFDNADDISPTAGSSATTEGELLQLTTGEMSVWQYPNIKLTNVMSFNSVSVGFSDGEVNSETKIKFTAKGQELLDTLPIEVMGSPKSYTFKSITLGAVSTAQWESLLREMVFVIYDETPDDGVPEEEKIEWVAHEAKLPGNMIYNAANGHYYEFVTESTALTWTEARAKAMGSVSDLTGTAGYLASITTQEEWDYVASLITQDVPTWLGGHKKDGTNKWYWADAPISEQSSPWYEGSLLWGFHNWNPGEPSNNGGTENSLLVLHKSDKKWNDVSEGATSAALAGGADATPIKSYVIEWSQAEKELPYAVVTLDHPITWAEAAAEAALMSNPETQTMGYLAEIGSQSENDIIETLAAGNTVWIGANKISGSWKWANSDTALTYSNWGSNVPSDEVITQPYSFISNFGSYAVYNYDIASPPVDLFSLKASGDNLIYTSGHGKQTLVLNPPIDLSAYDSMTIKVSAQTLTTSKGVRIGFATGVSQAAGDERIAYVDVYNTGTYTIDLSNITNTAYFTIRPINDLGDTGTLTFSQLTLNKTIGTLAYNYAAMGSDGKWSAHANVINGTTVEYVLTDSLDWANWEGGWHNNAESTGYLYSTHDRSYQGIRFCYCGQNSTARNYPTITNTVHLVKGHKYFLNIFGGDYGDSNRAMDLHFPAFGISIVPASCDEATIVSQISTFTGETGDYTITAEGGATGRNVSGLATTMNQCDIIDLTGTFGAGYEPSLEWCRENIHGISEKTVQVAVNYEMQPIYSYVVEWGVPETPDLEESVELNTDYISGNDGFYSGNNHYYEVVHFDQMTSYNEAVKLAEQMAAEKGVEGAIAHVDDEKENIFLSKLIQQSGAWKAWLSNEIPDAAAANTDKVQLWKQTTTNHTAKTVTMSNSAKWSDYEQVQIVFRAYPAVSRWEGVEEFYITIDTDDLSVKNVIFDYSNYQHISRTVQLVDGGTKIAFGDGLYGTGTLNTSNNKYSVIPYYVYGLHPKYPTIEKAPNGHYYSVVKLAAGTKWYDAKAKVEKMYNAETGTYGYLATITSNEEYEYIKKYLAKQMSAGNMNDGSGGGKNRSLVYIGAHGTTSKHEWYWNGGAATPKSESMYPFATKAAGVLWGIPEMSGAAMDNFAESNRVINLGATGGFDQDQYDEAYICNMLVEWSLPEVHELDGHYYTVVDAGREVSWDEAKAIASEMQISQTNTYGYLAHVTTKAENDFIYTNVVPKNEGGNPVNAWLGAARSADGYWYWDGSDKNIAKDVVLGNGTKTTHDSDTYAPKTELSMPFARHGTGAAGTSELYWGGANGDGFWQEPKSYEGGISYIDNPGNSVAHITTSVNGQNYWGMYSNSKFRYFIVEFSPPEIHKYEYHTFSEKLNAQQVADAKLVDAATGWVGYPATITSKAEATYVAKTAPNSSQWYIGAVKQPNDSKWYWVDGPDSEVINHEFYDVSDVHSIMFNWTESLGSEWGKKNYNYELAVTRNATHRSTRTMCVEDRKWNENGDDYQEGDGSSNYDNNQWTRWIVEYHGVVPVAPATANAKAEVITNVYNPQMLIDMANQGIAPTPELSFVHQTYDLAPTLPDISYNPTNYIDAMIIEYLDNPGIRNLFKTASDSDVIYTNGISEESKEIVVEIFDATYTYDGKEKMPKFEITTLELINEPEKLFEIYYGPAATRDSGYTTKTLPANSKNGSGIINAGVYPVTISLTDEAIEAGWTLVPNEFTQDINGKTSKVNANIAIVAKEIGVKTQPGAGSDKTTKVYDGTPDITINDLRIENDGTVDISHLSLSKTDDISGTYVDENGLPIKNVGTDYAIRINEDIVLIGDELGNFILNENLNVTGDITSRPLYAHSHLRETVQTAYHPVTKEMIEINVAGYNNYKDYDGSSDIVVDTIYLDNIVYGDTVAVPGGRLGSLTTSQATEAVDFDENGHAIERLDRLGAMSSTGITLATPLTTADLINNELGNYHIDSVSVSGGVLRATLFVTIHGSSYVYGDVITETPYAAPLYDATHAGKDTWLEIVGFKSADRLRLVEDLKPGSPYPSRFEFETLEPTDEVGASTAVNYIGLSEYNYDVLRNYLMLTHEGSMSVVPRILKIIVDGGYKKDYLASDPAINVIYEGFVNGDTPETALKGTLEIYNAGADDAIILYRTDINGHKIDDATTPADEHVEASYESYPIYASGLECKPNAYGEYNYVIEYVDGDIIVEEGDYTVHYNGNGATEGFVADSVHTFNHTDKLNKNTFAKQFTVTYDYNYDFGTEPAPKVERVNHKYLGWTQNLADTNSSDCISDNFFRGTPDNPVTSAVRFITDESYVLNLKYTKPNDEITLFAAWQSKKVSLPNAQRLGHEFLGWSTDSNATVPEYAPYDKYEVNSNITLYAVWELVDSIEGRVVNVTENSPFEGSNNFMVVEKGVTIADIYGPVSEVTVVYPEKLRELDELVDEDCGFETKTYTLSDPELATIVPGKQYTLTVPFRIPIEVDKDIEEYRDLAQTVRLTAMYEDGTVLYSTPVFYIVEDYFVEFHTVFE